MSDFTLVKMHHFWKSHVVDHFDFLHQPFFNGMLCFSNSLRHIVKSMYVSMPT